jgi:hypothetical protein
MEWSGSSERLSDRNPLAVTPFAYLTELFCWTGSVKGARSAAISDREPLTASTRSRTFLAEGEGSHPDTNRAAFVRPGDQGPARIRAPQSIAGPIVIAASFFLARTNHPDGSYRPSRSCSTRRRARISPRGLRKIPLGCVPQRHRVRNRHP